MLNTVKPQVSINQDSTSRPVAYVVDDFDQLKALGFKGKLLLMSGVDETTLNVVQKICTSRGLPAYPPLKKPFRIDALKERRSSKTIAPEADEMAIKGPAVSVERALAGGTMAL